MRSRKLTSSIVVGVAAIAVAGGSYGIVSTTSSGGSAAASNGSAAASGGFAGGHGPGGGGNARSGPAAGGASGTVGSVSTASFTMSTSAGQKVTVEEASATTYQKGTGSTSASAITTGTPVLVLGTTNGTTITATQVIVQSGERRRVRHCLLGRSLPAGCTDHVQAGRSDPGELESGIRDDRQRDGS